MVFVDGTIMLLQTTQHIIMMVNIRMVGLFSIMVRVIIIHGGLGLIKIISNGNGIIGDGLILLTKELLMGMETSGGVIGECRIGKAIIV